MGKLGIVVILLVLEQLSAIGRSKTILAVPFFYNDSFVSHSNIYECFSHVREQKRGPEGGHFKRAC